MTSLPLPVPVRPEYFFFSREKNVCRKYKRIYFLVFDEIVVFQASKMKKRIVILFTAITLAIAPFPLYAASPWLQKTSYGERTSAKLTFGLANTMLGWIDLFYEPNRFHNDGKNVWAGFAKGLIDTVLNEVGGAFHLATFMLPFDFILPDNGVDLSGTIRD